MFAGIAFLAVLAQASSPSIEIPFRTIAFGTNRLIKDGGAIVMRDSSAFDAYRTKMGTNDAKKPNVDWSKEQVVAIHAAGNFFGPDSLQVVKVAKLSSGGLEVNAALDRGDMPATPTPGVVPVLHKEGLYALIVVPSSKGEVTLRLVDPPAKSGDRSGTSGSR